MSILTAVILQEGWASHPAIAAELAEQWSARFVVRVRSSIAKAMVEGVATGYAFNSSSDEFIQGDLFIEPGDSAALAAAKLRRARATEYVEALGSLTPKEFEGVCRGVLSLMSVVGAQLTPNSGDGGIDFYGHLDIRDLLRSEGSLPSPYGSLSVWLVGQAKHFSRGKLATPMIRELVGSVELAKAGAFAGPSPVPQLAIRACDPVFYLFLTSGLVTRDGNALMKASGVISMDGAQIAAFLADHSVGVSGEQFDPQAFAAWVAEVARG